MKKIILAAVMSLALAGSQVQTAQAGGWPIAAGVIGGLAVGTAIGASVAHPVYYAPAPAYYYPPTTYYQPAPAVTYQAPVVYAQPAPTVVYAQPGYVAAPVITFGFGFGRPYWGNYRGYRGYSYYHGHR